MALLSDLATRAVAQCGNRSDITTLAQQKVCDAIRELCSGFPIEELETQTTTPYALTANQDVYSITTSTWLNTPTGMLADVLQTAMEMILYTNAGSYGIGQPWIKIKITPDQRIYELSPYTGANPTLCSRAGADSSGNQQLIFRPVPDAGYYTFLRYRRMHPFLTATTYPYSGSTFILPQEWESVIVDYASAKLWNGPLKEHDRAQATLRFLGLSQDEQGRLVPGVIQRLLTKDARELSQQTQWMDYRYEPNLPSM